MANNKKMVEDITSMEVDFAKWYTDIVKKAELCDYSSVKGCMIVRPYGYAIWENIQHILDAEFKKTGHQNVDVGAEFESGLERIQSRRLELSIVVLCNHKNSHTCYSYYQSTLAVFFKTLISSSTLFNLTPPLRAGGSITSCSSSERWPMSATSAASIATTGFFLAFIILGRVT